MIRGRHLRILEMAENGCGKSFLAADFPDPFILDYEDKLTLPPEKKLVTDGGDVAAWTITEADRFEDVYNFTRAFLSGDGKVVNEILSKPGRLATPGEWTVQNRSVLVDDGLGELGQLIMRSAMTNTAGGSRDVHLPGTGFTLELPSEAGYGVRDALLYQRLKVMKGRPVHYILTCHKGVQSVRALDEAVRVIPLMTGKAFPPAIPGFFHEVWELTKKVEHGTDGKKRASYWIDSIGDGQSLALRTLIGLPSPTRARWQFIEHWYRKWLDAGGRAE